MSNSQNFEEIKNHLFGKWKNSDRYKDFIVELSDDDIELGKKIAKERYENHRKLGKKNKSYGRPEEGREVLGCLGELAVIRWCQTNGFNITTNKFFDTTSELHHNDEFDADIVWDGENVSLEIKATEKPMNSKLIIPKHQIENNQADVYVLVCKIDDKRYCIKGFTNGESILDNFDTTLKKPAYTIHEKNLKINLNELLKGE
jgi:hypothetical protein